MWKMGKRRGEMWGFGTEIEIKMFVFEAFVRGFVGGNGE